MKPETEFYAQPVRSLQTMLRVISTYHTDLPSVIPDGIYGSQTTAAVSAFQRKFGIPVTGITDQGTWDMIVSVYEPAAIHVGPAQPVQIDLESGQVIRAGQQHHSLYLTQAMLMSLSRAGCSIPEPPLSGILDCGTAAALSGFQRLSSLPITGELDKITWKHLVLQFQLHNGKPEFFTPLPPSIPEG